MTSSSSSFRKRVYTKFGDKGETSLLYGGRVSKNNPHTEAYGITDEAVSAMGLGRATTSDQRVKDILRDLQRELFPSPPTWPRTPIKTSVVSSTSRRGPSLWWIT